jgi:hypothetical protein
MARKKKKRRNNSNYSGSIGVTKCIEVSLSHPKNVFISSIFSLGSHTFKYWGILEENCKKYFLL